MKQIAPVKKGDIVEIDITGLGSSGEGVGKYEGFTVFVPGALPQEKVKGKITLVKKSYSTAKLVGIIEPSVERVQPACPIYKQCGGCQLQHLSYSGQLEVKREQVQAALSRIGHLDVEALPVLGCANPWNYRNKTQMPLGYEKGKVVLGCYAQGTHKIIDTVDCPIQQEENNEIVAFADPHHHGTNSGTTMVGRWLSRWIGEMG